VVSARCSISAWMARVTTSRARASRAGWYWSMNGARGLFGDAPSPRMASRAGTAARRLEQGGGVELENSRSTRAAPARMPWLCVPRRTGGLVVVRTVCRPAGGQEHGARGDDQHLCLLLPHHDGSDAAARSMNQSWVNA